eukprot:TRINITY_DN29127_c0_g1_i1.p1 TRINITY_DN29127_c0_g1~~TRINITY_DN29127_c0_g1_i1.p1  ORF type:complete len:421 (-),score=59.58 TRINITY_DN29127_c0_g1_i1:220-1482(-)
MQGLGGTGAQQSKDCSFEAGSVGGAPLRVSWFLVIFFVYQLVDAMNNRGLPVWVRVLEVSGNEFILLATVLCHEMGHGTMARKRGGEISEVLLWPFGGICFTSRPTGRDGRQKLVDDLYIVAAGPATHFPMAGAWVVLLAAFAAASVEVVTGPSWHFLIPFSGGQMPCLSDGVPGCYQSYMGYLTYRFLAQGVQMNVMLFMFNVFFPMYPMDGAKLIVCTLQLFCGVSAQRAAKVLIYTSTPLAIIFIGYSLMGFRSGGLQPGITLFMGIMCLQESYRIWKLMQAGRLHTHPLFELARSSTTTAVDGMGQTQRLNMSDRDDEEMAIRAPQIQVSELRPFSGGGRTLGAVHAQPSAPSASDESGGMEAPAQDRPPTRSKWLDRFETDAAERNKSVRQLEDERLERERLRREQQHLVGGVGR